jgi:hypothetical protein
MIVAEKANLEKTGPEKASHSAPGARRQWIAPSWERLETPMEVTMYAGRR